MQSRAHRSALAALASLAALVLCGAVARAENPMPAGYPGRGRIGIEVQPMTAELREFFRAPPEHGLLVVRVEQGRPADLAKLKVGDVVIAAAGEPLTRPHDLVAIVARAPAGAPLALTLVRKGRTRTIEVTPDGEPASAAALDAWHERIGAPLPASPPEGEPTPAASPAPIEAPLQPVAQPQADSSPPVAPAPEAPAPEPVPSTR